VALEQEFIRIVRFSPVVISLTLIVTLRFSPVIIIPPMLHARLHFNVILTRRTNGQFGYFPKVVLSRKSARKC
jgi:hypothetical protein